MQVEALLILLLIGAVAGFLAGTIVKGYGFGVVGNIIVGIVGAVFGGWLLPQLGLFTGGGILGQNRGGNQTFPPHHHVFG